MNNKTIDDITKMQKYNQREFADIFKEIRKVMFLKYPDKDQQQGAQKACILIENYILNRPIK